MWIIKTVKRWQAYHKVTTFNCTHKMSNGTLLRPPMSGKIARAFLGTCESVVRDLVQHIGCNIQHASLLFSKMVSLIRVSAFVGQEIGSLLGERTLISYQFLNRTFRVTPPGTISARLAYSIAMAKRFLNSICGSSFVQLESIYWKLLIASNVFRPLLGAYIL